MYVPIEYPKALYRKGEHIAVQDAAEEEDKRKAGYDDWQADQDAMEAAATASADGEAAGATKPAKRGAKAE